MRPRQGRWCWRSGRRQPHWSPSRPDFAADQHGIWSRRIGTSRGRGYILEPSGLTAGAQKSHETLRQNRSQRRHHAPRSSPDMGIPYGDLDKSSLRSSRSVRLYKERAWRSDPCTPAKPKSASKSPNRSSPHSNPTSSPGDDRGRKPAGQALQRHLQASLPGCQPEAVGSGE